MRRLDWLADKLLNYDSGDNERSTASRARTESLAQGTDVMISFNVQRSRADAEAKIKRTRRGEEEEEEEE